MILIEMITSQQGFVSSIRVGGGLKVDAKVSRTQDRVKFSKKGRCGAFGQQATSLFWRNWTSYSQNK
jgi:hypothetical protein